MRRVRFTARFALALLLSVAAHAEGTAGWSDAERGQVASLSLSHLAPPPADPSNRYADDPRAAALGRRLFFDTQLSRNGKLACASCHRPELQFTDARPQSRGLRPVHRNAPSLLSAAWHRWLFWDGRADSLWMQALGPLLNADELGLSARALRETLDAHYRADYEPIFGTLAGQDEGRVLANTGKAIAAFERTLRPAPARFDDFADALGRGEPAAALTAQEQSGVRLFIGKAQCLRCHHGPLLTNEGFHNTGLGKSPGLPADPGRSRGVRELQASEFTCRGPHNDDPQRLCPHLEYLRAIGGELRGAFKVPSLRAVAETAPYMHDGRFPTLAAVLAHYNRAPGVHETAGHTELLPLGLNADELIALDSFLRTLSSPTASPRDKGLP